MAIGMPSGGKQRGDILPIFKWDAKAGDLIAVNRDPQPDGSWEKTDVEVALPIKAVIDFENLEVGWLSFASGSPDFVLAKVGTPIPAKPSEEHKFCIRMKMFTKEHGIREFSHTAKTVHRAIDTLHDQYVADADKHPGKMPVVTIEGVETVKVPTPQGELKFKVPKWKISAWTAPPAEMSGKPAEAAAPAPVAKPAPKPEPAPADDLEF